MTWYQNQNWSDELHRDFYEQYKAMYESEMGQEPPKLHGASSASHRLNAVASACIASLVGLAVLIVQ